MIVLQISIHLVLYVKYNIHMSNTIYILPLLDQCSQGEDCAYVLTFKATGCPNKSPTQRTMTWWNKQSDNKVFRDMFKYCKLVRDGKANRRQILQCCGEVNGCTQISCNKQTAWSTGNNSFVSLSYILLHIFIKLS